MNRLDAEQAHHVRAALDAIAGDVLRLSTIARVETRQGRVVAVLDWSGDGRALVPARTNRAAGTLAVGDEVLVVLVGRTPVVVCATGGPLTAPPTPTIPATPWKDPT